MLSSCQKTYYANFSPLSRGGALLIQEHPRRVCQGDAAVHAPPPEGPVSLTVWDKFERRFLADESTWAEPKNVYYQLYNDPEICEALLREFGLEGPHCHIINGHVPVKSKKGESPMKGGGRLLVIDGGFCKAYQQTTGIAGYTLIYNSACYRLVSHEPFVGRAEAIRTSQDIASTSVVFERLESRLKIAGTDVGRQLQEQIDDLMALLLAYRSGAIAEDHKEY